MKQVAKRASWILLLVFMFSSAAGAVEVEIVATTYPLRRGQQEGSGDSVTPYPRLGSPVCLQKNQQLKLRLVIQPGDPEIIGWKILEAQLKSKVNETVHILYAEGETTPLHSPGATVTLDSGQVPDYIDYAELRANIIFQVKVGDPETRPSLSPTSTYSSSSPYLTDAFIVLEAPKAPMSPAWVTVLENSCAWARGETTADGAAQKLTQALYSNGEYNNGQRAHTSVDGQTFYLKDLLGDPGFPYGQCDDFADFLVCLITSVGSHAQTAQRSNVDSGQVVFRTNTIIPAGLTARTVNWTYHQFTVFGSNVWDACLAFSGPVLPVKMAREPTYRDNLVDSGASGPPNFPVQYQWSPQASFTPSVTAAPKP